MNKLHIWDQVKETDPAFIKKDETGVNKYLTSIDGLYMFKRATETFGPVGIGWGYSILEERYEDIVMFKSNNLGDIMSKNHTIKLELWYKVGEDTGKIINFGHTKYIYKTNRGAVMVDEEAPKKSLTDAIKKCLSMLGVCADVYMGMFDDREYEAERKRQSDIENADDRDAEIMRQSEEFSSWIDSEIQSYKKIDSLKSLKTVYTAHMRKCERRGSAFGKQKFTEAYNNRIKEIGE